MGKDTCYVPVDVLKNFIQDVFMALGVSKEDAQTCSDVIIESDLRGIESHGVGRLRYYQRRMISGQHQVKTNFEIVKESPTTALVDGHHGLGMIIGTRSMRMAIEKARKYGMGSVAVRNSTHFGIAGYYPSMAIREGMIGFTVTNARPSTSPTFGVQPLLGTNPIAFGAPTDEEFPFIYDGATPITQRGKIEVYAREEKNVPEGWIIDEHNRTLTNADEILGLLTKGKASFLPLGGAGETLGGHKGYGLATVVEILSASLQNGAFLTDLSGVDANGKVQPFRVGHFFMAINIESFISLDQFKATTGRILRTLRNSQRAPGQNRIYTAGEKEFEIEKIVRAKGVPIVPNLQKDLKFLQNEYKLDQYDFPF